MKGREKMSLYNKNRDVENLSDYYVAHISAMTTEDLRSKSDIAAELAYRDEQIDIMRSLLENIKNSYVACGYYLPKRFNPLWHGINEVNNYLEPNLEQKQANKNVFKQEQKKNIDK